MFCRGFQKVYSSIYLRHLNVVYVIPLYHIKITNLDYLFIFIQLGDTH